MDGDEARKSGDDGDRCDLDGGGRQLRLAMRPSGE